MRRPGAGGRRALTLNKGVRPVYIAIKPATFDAGTVAVESLKSRNEAMLGKLRIAMLNNGVDLKGWRGGILSAAHTQADVDLTVDAWRKSLRAMKEEGLLVGAKDARAVAV